MDRVEQADEDEGEQQGRRCHSHPVGADATPGREQRWAPGDQHAETDTGGYQQPDQHIGPEDDDLKTRHSKRIRGSTRV